MPVSSPALIKEDKPAGRLIISQLAQTLVMFLIIGSILFLSAGRLDWWQAWAFLSVYFLLAAAGAIWMARTNPGLARERNRPGRNVKKWDNLMVGLNLLLTLGLFVVIGLDAGRYRWSVLPFGLRMLGLLGFIPAFGLPLWASIVNNYLSSRVRIQEERGHEVIADGPYRFIRHPMYIGMIFYNLSVPLLLGSWCGLVVGVAMMATVILRTVLEDRTLQRELPGYREYSQRVRYRLFPGIW